MDKINKARNSTYKLAHHSNVDSAIIDKNISKIIEVFKDSTNGFENNPCLKFKEEEIDDNYENCYVYIGSKIRSNYLEHYEITIGETPYCGTVYNYNYLITYSFFLGPLYFEVSQTKC